MGYLHVKDFQFDDFNNFSAQHVSPSGMTPTPTNYTPNFYPHGPCLFCSNPYHSSSNCPSWGQFYNFSYNFSSPRFESNSNFYNPDRSNRLDFSWQAQATANYAPQCHELHHPEYSQFDIQSFHHSSYNRSIPQSTLEDTIKIFMQLTSEDISEMKNATMVNT